MNFVVKPGGFCFCIFDFENASPLGFMIDIYIKKRGARGLKKSARG